MDISNGVFIAPRHGKYDFTFSGVRGNDIQDTRVALRVNGNVVATSTAFGPTPASFTLQATLELKSGDMVSIILLNGSLGYGVHQFSGYLVEEDLVFKLPPRVK